MDLQAPFVDFAETEPASHHEAQGAPSLRGALLKLLHPPFSFVFFLTILFLAMRGVLDQGCMVAVGPYDIAHPAPC